MRVLLAQPPLTLAKEVIPPLGLCTLASWLIHVGHEVQIIDLDLEIKCRANGAPQSFVQPFLDAMDDFRPNMVGVTSMYSNSLQAEHLVQAAKRCDARVTTVAGGSHFGAQGVSSLRRIAELDYVVEGEAELALAALLSALEYGDPVSEIPRVCHRVHGQPKANPPGPLIALAELPPTWTALDGCIDLHRYARTIPEHAARRVAYVEAGRGCPFSCTFCATSPFWQRKYRVKPAHRLVDEIRFLHESFGYDSFVIVHDLLTANAGFVSEFCDAMIESRLPVEWMANSRTDLRMHGLLPKMKAAGCWKLFLGVESASARVQATIDKHLKPDDVLSHIVDLRDHGISATCSFVIGFPNESTAELSSTLAMGARLKVLGVETVQFHRLRLFPPAPLSRSGLHVAFDVDALRIEYPFLQIPQEEIVAIAGDPEFFEGYFAPESAGGSSVQLAQVEMFFHHAIALAPLTIGALADLSVIGLVSSFYDALADCGCIEREKLDWELGNLYDNWLAIQPLLEGLVWKHQGVGSWQAELIRGLLDYEFRRLQFVSRHPAILDVALTSSANWVAIESKVDIARVIDRLASGVSLSAELLSTNVVVFSRNRDGSLHAYTIDDALRPRLLLHHEDLISAIAS